MCWRIFLICGFLVMCLAVYVSNGLEYLRGVGDADTKMMRNLSRAVLVYHEELGDFLGPNAREDAAALEKRFGVASDVGISTIEHTGVKGFVFAKVTRNGVVHEESIMFGQGTIWDVSSESASDL